MDVGVSARDFIELSKLAFVDAARDRYGKNGRPATVAMMVEKTRLSKNDIYRLRELLVGFPEFDVTEPMSIESSVMMHWYTSADFHDEQGLPVPLRSGPGPGSLFELIESCSASHAPDDVVQSLLSQNLIVKDGGLYRPVSRNVSTPKDSYGFSVTLHSALLRLCQTINHNFMCGKDDTWPQRTVYSEAINADDVARIRRAVRERAIDVCFGIDDFLDSNTAVRLGNDDARAKKRYKVGFGVYYFEDVLPD